MKCNGSFWTFRLAPPREQPSAVMSEDRKNSSRRDVSKAEDSKHSQMTMQRGSPFCLGKQKIVRYDEELLQFLKAGINKPCG